MPATEPASLSRAACIAFFIKGTVLWAHFMVPSLLVPDPGNSLSTGELVGYEAVRLFVERARAADSGFEPTEGNAPAVARLCNRLDGIPLAIELAAARTRVLTVEQVLEKLDDPLGLLIAVAASGGAVALLGR